MEDHMFAKEFAGLFNAAKISEQENVAINKIQTSIRMWETVLEHVPTAVTMVCLMFLSQQYERINVFLDNSLKHQLNLSSEAVFALITFMTTSSIVTAVTSIRYIILEQYWKFFPYSSTIFNNSI